jgi:hypothetical protein
MHTKFWLESLKEKRHSEDLDTDRKIILEWILEKQSVTLWAGFIWHRIGTSSMLL